MYIDTASLSRSPTLPHHLFFLLIHFTVFFPSFLILSPPPSRSPSLLHPPSLPLSSTLPLSLSPTHKPLLQEYLPDLYQHFQANRIETHMYASQWFLTIYTAKFPLSIVFRILDIYLCEVRVYTCTCNMYLPP